MLKFVCMSRRGLGKKRQNKREKKMIEQNKTEKKIGIFRSIDTRYIYLDERTDGQMDG